MPDLIIISYKLTTNVYSYRVDTTYISGQLEFISKFKYPPTNYLFMGFLRYVCEIVTGRMYTLIFVLSTPSLINCHPFIKCSIFCLNRNLQLIFQSTFGVLSGWGLPQGLSRGGPRGLIVPTRALL